MRPCEVGFLYYADSMQTRAMALMGKKMMAARNLNGQFSAEGLAAMAGDDAGLEMELAKSIADAMPESNQIRSWAKASSGRKARAVAPREVEEEADPGDLAFDEGAFDGLGEEAFDGEALEKDLGGLGV